jgi:hypothetical protein
MDSVMSLISVVKTRIKRMILDDPRISVDEIHSALAMNDHHLSKIAISSIRGEFRHSLRFLIEQGVITADALKHKEIKDSLIGSGVRYREQKRPAPTSVRRKPYHKWHFPD